MEELRSGKFWGGDETLHETAIGRVYWRRIRNDWKAQGTGGSAPRGYETSYDVARGYSEDRFIIRP